MKKIISHPEETSIEMDYDTIVEKIKKSFSQLLSLDPKELESLVKELLEYEKKELSQNDNSIESIMQNLEINEDAKKLAEEVLVNQGINLACSINEAIEIIDFESEPDKTDLLEKLVVIIGLSYLNEGTKLLKDRKEHTNKTFRPLTIPLTVMMCITTVLFFFGTAGTTINSAKAHDASNSSIDPNHDEGIPASVVAYYIITMGSAGLGFITALFGNIWDNHYTGKVNNDTTKIKKYGKIGGNAFGKLHKCRSINKINPKPQKQLPRNSSQIQIVNWFLEQAIVAYKNEKSK